MIEWSKTVPCGLCGTPTNCTGTKRCDRCWELEHRIEGDPNLALKILANLTQTQMVLVPRIPTEPMWGGLARSIVMWQRMNPQGSGKSLHKHLDYSYGGVPSLVTKEIPDTDHVPPKGSIAIIIYQAMIDDYYTNMIMADV